MASQSSRPKNDSRIRRDYAARLLRHGVSILNPSVALRQHAKRLERMGIVQTSQREFVRCADPLDADFPPRDRHCQGRCYLADGFDEAGHDYRCQDCHRPVFPFRHRKRRHAELYSKVLPRGVEAYLTKALSTLNSGVKQIATGVYQVDVGTIGVIVCVVDYCGDERFASREWASTHPTCYVVVDSTNIRERFHDEEWLQRTSLADLVSGHVDLTDLVLSTTAAEQPTAMRRISMPVYTKAVRPVAMEPVHPPHTGRQFVVEVGPNVVRVDGVKVVAEQAGPRFILFHVLWQCFLEDLKAGLPPEQFHAKPLNYLIQELELQTKQRCNDEMTVRRAINRLQSDIQKAVKKKLGLPIDREDVVQTCRRQGQLDNEYGYRINPFTVIARPFQSNPS